MDSFSFPIRYHELTPILPPKRDTLSLLHNYRLYTFILCKLKCINITILENLPGFIRVFKFFILNYTSDVMIVILNNTGGVQIQ